MRRYLPHILVLLGILGVAFAPLLVALGAGMFAEWNGCQLHEGFRNPCVVGGIDFGETLYTLFVFGWIAMATIPIGGIFLLAWLVWVLITLVRHARSRS